MQAKDYARTSVRANFVKDLKKSMPVMCQGSAYVLVEDEPGQQSEFLVTLMPTKLLLCCKIAVSLLSTPAQGHAAEIPYLVLVKASSTPSIAKDTRSCMLASFASDTCDRMEKDEGMEAACIAVCGIESYCLMRLSNKRLLDGNIFRAPASMYIHLLSTRELLLADERAWVFVCLPMWRQTNDAW